MLIAWIVITLLLALVVGLIAAGVSNDGFGFFFGFVVVCQISLFIGVLYVAGHFIGKYW